MEDTVIGATMSLLASEENIYLIADTIYRIHEKETNDSTTLKLLEKKRKEVQKKSDNIIKAIEMGIITEQTKIRLKELEQELLQIDFDIDREKQRTYTFLTINDIKQFLKSKVFTDTSSIKVRKLIVNTFIREIIYYPDKLIITYNFSDAIDTINLSPENAKEIERQSKSAFSLDIGSSICQYSSPNPRKHHDRGAFSFSRVWWARTLIEPTRATQN